MKRMLIAALLCAIALPVWGQADRHDVRAGNRKFRKGAFKEAEIDYRKAVLKDTASVAGQYDLASALYRQEDYEGAAKALEAVKESAPQTAHAADYFFNAGDVALQRKDYKTAVEAFKQCLLRQPDDMAAKENYTYAKLMLDDQEQGGGGGGQDNQDQNQDQNQNQDQDQNQDQNQNQNQNQDQNQGDSQPQPQDSKISPQQAQQILQAIQAKEKETQDKVNKEKAAMLKSRQREKNW